MQAMSNTPTALQVETLLSFLEKHPDLARGSLRDTQGRVKSRNLWNQLTDELNSVGGCRKSIKKWQKFWADKKYLAKKAAAIYRSAATSEAGPSSAAQLSAQEARIIAIVGEGNGAWDISDLQVRAFTPPATKYARHDSPPSSPDFPSRESPEETSPLPKQANSTEQDQNLRKRLIEIEEERLATEVQRTQELALLRESVQELGRIVQTSFQEMLAELRTWRK